MTSRLGPPPGYTLTEFQRPSGRGPARALESPGALEGLRVCDGVVGYNRDVGKDGFLGSSSLLASFLALLAAHGVKLDVQNSLLNVIIGCFVLFSL